MKRQPSEWEEIIANETTNKGLLSKIHKQLMQLTSRRATQSKTGQKTDTDISPKKTQRWLINTKRCSTSLIIREIQTKTKMRFHLTPLKMAVIKKSANNKSWKGCKEKGSLLHYWWGCKLIQPLRRTVWRCL